MSAAVISFCDMTPVRRACEAVDFKVQVKTTYEPRTVL